MGKQLLSDDLLYFHLNENIGKCCSYKEYKNFEVTTAKHTTSKFSDTISIGDNQIVVW